MNSKDITARIDSDYYKTPAWCYKNLPIDWKMFHNFCEPAAGDFRIYDYLRPNFSSANAHWYELREGKNWFKNDTKYDLIITNPPYSIGFDYVKYCLEYGDTVILLLRLGFLGSKSRYPFFMKNEPCSLYTLSTRPSFVDVCKNKGCEEQYHKEENVKICKVCKSKVRSGTDNSEYAWFVWDKTDRMDYGIFHIMGD